MSGRAILQALCEGESDPERLAKRVCPGVKAGQEEIRAALTGEVREHHRFVLRKLLSLIAVQDQAIEHLEEEIERHLYPFEEQITRCERINGVSRHVLYVLMAEIGTGLERFPDAEHLSRLRGGLSWTEGKRREATEW
ncbi:MAG: hypothetical protein J2P37_24900 [Ktedonobacteraceae bacterium]|nr:hypothetical protein [Ktedonobacteraceae bacterium]